MAGRVSGLPPVDPRHNEIVFKAVGPERDVLFRIGKCDRISSFYKAYENLAGLPFDDLRFFYGGEIIAQSTVEELGLAENEEIDVWEKRNGELRHAEYDRLPRDTPTAPPIVVGLAAATISERRKLRMKCECARHPTKRAQEVAAARKADAEAAASIAAIIDARTAAAVNDEPAWKRFRLEELLAERTRADLAEAAIADARKQTEMKEAARVAMQKDYIAEKRRAERAELELEDERREKVEQTKKAEQLTARNAELERRLKTIKDALGQD